MKIRAKANGDVIDVPDDAASTLLEAGIYEPAEETKPTKHDPPAPKKPAPKKSTTVAPMTTEDMPSPARKGT